MNEKQFISPISGYNHKIIKKYEFKIYLNDCLFHTESTVDKIMIPIKNQLLINPSFMFLYLL